MVKINNDNLSEPVCEGCVNDLGASRPFYVEDDLLAQTNNINFNELVNDCGIEYSLVLKKVLEIRKNRRNIYGDSFLDEELPNLLAIVEGKMNRFKVLMKNDNPVSRIKREDELVDTINYLIFILCILQEKELEYE